MSITDEKKYSEEMKERKAKRIAESKDLWLIELALENFSKKHDTEYFCTVIFRKIDPDNPVPYQAIFKKGEIAEKIRNKIKIQEYQMSVTKDEAWRLREEEEK